MSIVVLLVCASKSRACFIYYVHTTACGAHKLIHCCHEIHIFPCRAAACTLWMPWLWHSILFSGWVECSIELELESSIVGQDWMPSLNCLYSKPPWLMQPLFSSPFSFSPAAAVHHKQDPGLVRHDQNSSSSSSLSSSSCFPPPLLGASSDTEMTNPSPSVWDVRCHNTSTWLTSHRCLWPSSNVLELLWMI